MEEMTRLIKARAAWAHQRSVGAISDNERMRCQKKAKEWIRALVVQEYQRGQKDQSTIALEYRVSERSVQGWVKRAGKVRRHGIRGTHHHLAVGYIAKHALRMTPEQLLSDRAAKRRMLYDMDAQYREVAKRRVAIRRYTTPGTYWLKGSRLWAVNEGDGTVTREALTALYAQHPSCTYCGKAISGSSKTIDHIIPLARGGRHTLSNLTIACPKCNRQKGARLPHEFGSFSRVS